MVSDIVLVYPPLTDPTSGYHSLSYLDAFARSHGLEQARIIDANIESFYFSLTENEAKKTLRIVQERRTRLEAGDSSGLNDREQTALWVAGRTSPEEVRAAVGILKDPDAFYQYPLYRWATERVISWMNTLSATGAPGSFGANSGFSFFASDVINWFSLEDLRNRDLIDRINRPFEGYVTELLLPRLRDADLVGMNVTYQEQLPFALYMLRRLHEDRAGAERFPRIMVGGTEVSGVWKYLPKKQKFFELFDGVDLAVVGEGESAYAEILRTIERPTSEIRHPNVLVNVGRERVPQHALPLYENVKQLPTPTYDQLPWEMYLSPHRYAYYSPTRGCYWNKCTFCDYGLNFESPTSPWRQDPVEKMVHDIRQLSKEADFFYLSVDVLAPAAMLRFAERLRDERIDVKWGAEIRLEKYWSAERCQTLRDGGCVVVSVGYESGNQRILDLMDKGTSPTQVRATIRALSEAGVGVEMMGFTGFPTETLEEGMESIDFLLENRDYWTVGGMGEFILTAGAIVARQPERFGITDVRPHPDDDIVSVLQYDDPTQSQQTKQALHQAKQKLRRWHFQRPWLGGIDTPHTYFYHDRFGTGILDEMQESMHRGITVDTLLVPNGHLEEVLASMQELVGATRVFVHGDSTVIKFPNALLGILGQLSGDLSFRQAAATQGVADQYQQEQLLLRLLEAHIVRRPIDIAVHAAASARQKV
jgi:radical SAM family protein